MRSLFNLGAGIIAVVGIGAIACKTMESANPPSEVINYLQRQGYSHVQGGEKMSFFNSCGNSIPSRDYQAVNPKGKAETKTVCFSPFGNYISILG